MKKVKYSEEQIIGVLKEAEAGMPIVELCRKYGISDATYYNWKAKYAGMTVSDLRRLKALEAENRRLRKENHLLENQLVQYREGYLEALRLQKILKLKEQFDTTPVIARVIDREQPPIFKSILIDKGTAHGLMVGFPVLNDQGLVGRITECSWHISRIMLIVDVNSNVSVLLQRSRTHGVLQGAGAAGCRLKYVPKTEEVKVGDAVISSGLGGIFPKGIILGVVAAVDKKGGGFFQRIDVQPSVDFGKLEEVVVLNPQRDRKP